MTLLAHFVFVIVFCIVWFGSVLLVGFVFESRLVPLFKYQSKAFCPGDIALGVMFLALWKEYHEYGASLPNYWLAVSVPLTLGLYTFNVWLLKKDRAFYAKRAANSPTKLWHDFMGFFVMEVIIANAAFLLLLEVILGHQSFGSVADPVMFIIALAFYAACDVWDVKHPATQRMVNARHIEDWKPLWKKSSN